MQRNMAFLFLILYSFLNRNTYKYSIIRSLICYRLIIIKLSHTDILYKLPNPNSVSNLPTALLIFQKLHRVRNHRSISEQVFSSN